MMAASLGLGLAGCRHSTPSRSSVAERDTRQFVTWLADDARQGRGVGTAGIDQSAQYIAADFAQAGLQHLGSLEDYYQPFEITTDVKIADSTSLALGDDVLKLNEDFRPLGLSRTGTLDGDIAFVGYGISSKKFDYDDYAAIDVKGKTVLAMRYEPHDANGKSRFEPMRYSEEAGLERKATVAAEHGAVALLYVTPPKHHGGDKLMNFTPAIMGGETKIPVVQVSQNVAERMLKEGGAPELSALQTSIDTNRAPDARDLAGLRVKGRVAFDRVRAPVKNVIGLLPGSGPHKDEYVVIGAHYDHVGMGGPMSLAPGVRAIHNGADDNASGTSVVMELAGEMGRKSALDRSVLFAAFTGEESGLLGSKQFVEHPPVPLEKVVAMLNLDMVGRVRDETLYIGGRGTADAFDQILNRIDDGSPLKFKDIGKGGLGPTDSMSFAMHHIPVLFLFSGMHGDYHRPSDDSDKINYFGLAEVTKVAGKIIFAMASMPRAEYVTTYDRQRYSITPGSGGENGASLGVVPDYSSDMSTGGVKITGTVPGSPAESAELLPGDVIVKFNDRVIDNLHDLLEVLAGGKPGDAVTLMVKRSVQEIELHATLAKKAGS